MDKKNSSEKGLMVFFLTIPWPWHVGLGAVAYIILHVLAERGVPVPDQTPEEVALYTHRIVWKTAASIFQYLIPAVFGLLAILSFHRARKKRKSSGKSQTKT